jgi:hypothetical protein
MEIDVKKLLPTFICGHRRSGTTLLSAILDSHCDLLVYPEDSKFFQLFFPKIAESDWTPRKKKDYLVEHNLGYLRNVLEKCSGVELPPERWSALVKVFDNYVGSSNDWKEYLVGMLSGYASIAAQRSNSVKRWVEKTTSSEMYALKIDDAFPGSKFIHIVRDPRDNYASLKAGWESKYRHLSDTSTLELLRQSCIFRGRLGFEIGIMNEEVLGKHRYKIIRYEDLVDPAMKNNVLRDIAEFLEVTFSGFQLMPTIAGTRWRGNSFSEKTLSEVTSSRVGTWENELDSDEVALMEFSFLNSMRLFEYELRCSRKAQIQAASNHYKWMNEYGGQKSDYSLWDLV